MAFPLVFLCYTLIRGAIVGWYPYNILDPGAVGSGGVAKYVVTISLDTHTARPSVRDMSAA